jgi:hypothetical protein
MYTTPISQVWRAVLLYPALVALVSILFLFLSESFTWMWLRLVVVDIWMLFVLTPAAYHWLPYNTDIGQYGPLAQELPAVSFYHSEKNEVLCTYTHMFSY